MNPKSDREELLDDVLREGDPSARREALLEHTLHRARRTRRQRRLANAGLLALVAVAMFAATDRLMTRPPGGAVIAGPGPSARSQAPFREITTVPTPAPLVITTQHFASIVTTATSDPAASPANRGRAYTLILTQPDPKLHFLSDTELLALVPGPALLRRTGANAQELILLNETHDSVVR